MPPLVSPSLVLSFHVFTSSAHVLMCMSCCVCSFLRLCHPHPSPPTRNTRFHHQPLSSADSVAPTLSIDSMFDLSSRASQHDSESGVRTAVAARVGEIQLFVKLRERGHMDKSPYYRRGEAWGPPTHWKIMALTHLYSIRIHLPNFPYSPLIAFLHTFLTTHTRTLAILNSITKHASIQHLHTHSLARIVGWRGRVKFHSTILDRHSHASHSIL